MEWVTIRMSRNPGDLESSVEDGELMLVVGKRWRDADILASLQAPFTVNQIVYSIDDQLHQLHLKDNNPSSLLLQTEFLSLALICLL